MKAASRINAVAWIAMGLALGVALGLALDNLAVGMALGIAIGGGAVVVKPRQKRESKQLDGN